MLWVNHALAVVGSSTPFDLLAMDTGCAQHHAPQSHLVLFIMRVLQCHPTWWRTNLAVGILWAQRGLISFCIWTKIWGSRQKSFISTHHIIAPKQGKKSLVVVVVKWWRGSVPGSVNNKFLSYVCIVPMVQSKHTVWVILRFVRVRFS